MHILIAATGSYGDIYPFVGLAGVLRDRGHEVEFCSNEYFRPTAEAEGLAFVGVGSAEDYEQIAGDPDLWHPTRGTRVVLDAVGRYLPRSYEALSQRYRSGETLLVGSTLSLGARVLRETHGGCLVTVHLAPVGFRSDEDPIALPFGSIPAGSLKPLRRGLWWFIDRVVLDPLIAPVLNEFRATHGLAPVERVFRDWIHSPDCTLGLFPDWFAPRRSDWPRQAELAGFPLYDAVEHATVPEALDAFLDAGAAPALFAPGTANQAAGDFFETSLAACERAGWRALLVSQYGRQVSRSLPHWARHFDYLPFSRVLPRCGAFVSHGGIGSVSQGLRAGVPQIVRPMGFDQFDNGMRARRLGVAHVLPVRKYTPESVAAALYELVTPDCLAACRRVAAKFDGVSALTEAAEIVERAAAV